MTYKKNIIYFLKKIKRSQESTDYLLIFFIISLLFWYLFFYELLNLKKLVLLSILSMALLHSGLRIFKKIPHHHIRNDYNEQIKTLMRIFIFFIPLVVLLNLMNTYEIIDIW